MTCLAQTFQMQPISTFRSCCHHLSQLTRQSWTSQKKVSSSCLLCFDKSSLNIGIKKIIGLAGWKVQETAPRRPPTAPPRVGTGCKTKSFKLSPLSLNFLRPVTSCYKASQLRRLSSVTLLYQVIVIVMHGSSQMSKKSSCLQELTNSCDINHSI